MPRRGPRPVIEMRIDRVRHYHIAGGFRHAGARRLALLEGDIVRCRKPLCCSNQQSGRGIHANQAPRLSVAQDGLGTGAIPASDLQQLSAGSWERAHVECTDLAHLRLRHSHVHGGRNGVEDTVRLIRDVQVKIAHALVMPPYPMVVQSARPEITTDGSGTSQGPSAPWLTITCRATPPVWPPCSPRVAAAAKRRRAPSRP